MLRTEISDVNAALEEMGMLIVMEMKSRSEALQRYCTRLLFHNRYVCQAQTSSVLMPTQSHSIYE